MATNSLDIVSLATMRSELRITVDDHDALLIRQINSAVSFVSEALRAPLLDRAEGFRCRRPGDPTYPIVIPSVGVRSVASVKYWTPDGNLGAYPNGSISVPTLGRFEQSKRGFAIYPPSAGWPEVLPNSLIELVVVAWDERGGCAPSRSSLMRSSALRRLPGHPPYRGFLRAD